MAKPAKDVSLAEFGASHGFSEEWARKLVNSGMPYRKTTRGQFRIVSHSANAWLIAKEVEKAVAAVRDETAPDEAKERARKMRAEAELKEMEVARIRGQQVPVEQYEERAEAFVGGFAAVAAGQLHRFERDIVKAMTAAEARRLTQQMHAALMHGAQEYADTLEAEVQATEPGEEAA